MKWKDLIVPVKTLDGYGGKAFIARTQEGSYQLVDVRQPREYENSHLPGARLIPLSQLPSRLAELDKGKPTIVYCAVGGRSRSAAQYLQGNGFREVYNLVGGIKGWMGDAVSGSEGAGLDMFAGDENFSDASALAYAMENGMQQFYEGLAERFESADMKAMFKQLATVEENHKHLLVARFEKRTEGRGDLLPRKFQGIMEGGVAVKDRIDELAQKLKNVREILETALALELQAFDVYSRMSQKSSDPDARELFLRLSNEEKKHLFILSERYDTLL